MSLSFGLGTGVWNFQAEKVSTHLEDGVSGDSATLFKLFKAKDVLCNHAS